MGPATPHPSRRTFLALAAAVAAAGGAAPPARATASGHRILDQRSIDTAAASLEPSLIGLRRDLHRHPEVSGDERRTAAVVADRLRSAGLAVTTGIGGHGVVGLLHGARPGRTVGYRADMDAVRQHDPTAPAAHQCGHDLHTAVGVGIAEVLARFRARLAGTVAFVFQPAEEDLAGAQAMLDDGLLRRTGLTELHAVHCGPVPVGSIAVTPGFGMPGLDQVVATLSGPDADGRAASLAAAVRELATVAFPGTPEEMEQLIDDLRTPHGPLARFVNIQTVRIAAADGTTTLRTSYRCWPEERYVEVRDRIRVLADVHGAHVEFPSRFPALVSPRPEADSLHRHLRRALGPRHVEQLFAAPPFNGEDFALIAHRVPVTYSFLGVHTPGSALTTAFPHHPDFAPDERAVATGVRAMSGWLAHRAQGAPCRL